MAGAAPGRVSGGISRRIPGAPAIELVAISKRFGAVQANRAVDLTVHRGEIHGIIGENGAGKSTLMSILNGFYTADSGHILVGGREVRIATSADAIALGIEMVHQHFMLVESFTVLENVMLGAEGGALLAKGRARARAELGRLATEYGLSVDPDALVGDLPVGAQQRVEILKALYRGAEVLILDEPTGVLTPQEADDLFRVLRALRSQGKTVLLITHKLREIMAVTDRVSVMRAGEMVAHRTTAETSVEELGELMIGRRLRRDRSKPPARPGPLLLEVEGLGLRDAAGVERLADVSFALRGGEILGVAGVAGNGQSELLEVLAGMRVPGSGRIRLRGKDIFPGAMPGPAEMRRRRVAHVPEDRLKTGLVRSFPAMDSAILGYEHDPAWRRAGLLDPARIEAHAERLMREHDVRPVAPRLRSALFSGGNQQKLIMGREIGRDPELILVGQPTRGVDIGGIDAIHARLLAARAAGKAVLLVSVELDEVLRLSDRILVMCGGRVMGELPAAEADEAVLGLMMAGAARGDGARGMGTGGTA
ncbi:Nucleoside transport ATP-binding protein [Roseomonas mucosa]|uniref:Galactose/methyl galactoside import ATP-binding protein MglA n=1 Tax=Roseomonas mucosa TaxID=207340 RepID=A0A379MY55_9PROT|nr:MULTISPECIES: ABC transporter ATP-binding protein [Roseomonas]MBS5902811.1 ABC transporter ATP-binding protein [Acetobacteraceae bacterium]AWV24504.1 Nucleoside transport ATP-binding protein [Roseomonas mucosa]MCG7350774.1 ABC transporter ATP-binding protein [Roseomonas mucosa]MCG7356187.1 ABC transporter ATP-binding protein [Roseomonas mucosa]QDD96710.1 Nucleoside transport ATP-binding protein [Roseomonas mucosa]